MLAIDGACDRLIGDSVESSRCEWHKFIYTWRHLHDASMIRAIVSIRNTFSDRTRNYSFNGLADHYADLASMARLNFGLIKRLKNR